MQDGAGCRTVAIEDQVQPGFGGRLSRASQHTTIEVNLHQAGGRDRALVQAAGSEQYEPTRADAEVAAGSCNPTATVAPARRRAKRFGGRLKNIRIGNHSYTPVLQSVEETEAL